MPRLLKVSKDSTDKILGVDEMIKIMLDPGHGAGKAHNRGFKQIDNLPYCNEGDCNFLYAKNYLKPELERYGFQVGLTKNNIAENPSLKARGNAARGYDLFLSCHSNAADGRARGVEVWDSTNPRESCKQLGDLICRKVSEALGIPNRGTKYRRANSGANYYGVLRNGLAKRNMIIEHCFHDNLEDARVYRSNLDKCAKAVAKAVAEFYGLEVKSKVEPPAAAPEDTFIKNILKAIEGQKLNILPSVTIAQAILESNWGRSELAKGANNLFGIKASKEWKGEIYSIKADFRKYPNFIESIKDHDIFFISTPWREKNYAAVLGAKEYKTQALALQKCGYATDQKYGTKLINLIERLGLQQYDKGQGEYVVRDINEPSEWAKEDWKWAKENKITDGNDPKGNCTREQVAAMIKRYHDSQSNEARH